MTSNSVSTEQVLQQLNWRYATKKFDPTKKIPEEVWQTLTESLVLTPSSFGLQPWKFFIISNPELRQQLVEHSWGQKQVVDASHLVVLTIKKEMNEAEVDRYVQYTAQVRHVEAESLAGFGKVIKGFLANPNLNISEWASRQVYIALGQFMATAAFLNIDTCPMEGFVPAKYDEILGLSELGYHSVLVCPAGYRAEDDKYASQPKVRYPQEEVIQYI